MSSQTIEVPYGIDPGFSHNELLAGLFPARLAAAGYSFVNRSGRNYLWMVTDADGEKAGDRRRRAKRGNLITALRPADAVDPTKWRMIRGAGPISLVAFSPTA